MNEALVIEHLSVEFRHDGTWVRVVDDVSFEIHPGDRLAIVGESGSGKSVTALAIVGLLDPAGRVVSGSARLGGLDLITAGRKALEDVRGRRIAMVFQDALSALDPVFTIGQQIGAVLKRHMPSLTKSDRLERSIELLRAVGIADPQRRLSNYPHQMSGGMRQRALIASALAGDPEILIADEPTTALDVTVQAQIVQLLHDLADERSMALVMITHDLGVVGEVADRALVMYSGSIVEDVLVDNLFNGPRHPYTAALLASIPRLVGTRPRRLDAIAGAPPRAGSWPSGCTFAPRCSFATDACLVRPVLVAEAGTRLSCHHPLRPLASPT